MVDKIPTLYKVLDMNNCSMNGGDCKWEVGVQTPHVPVSPFSSGYHLTEDPIDWASRPCRIYIAKGYGECDNIGGDLYIYESAILLEEIKYSYLYYYAYVMKFYCTKIDNIERYIYDAYGVKPKHYSKQGLLNMLKLDITNETKIMFKSYLIKYYHMH